MIDKNAWDDQSREELRELIQQHICGQLRLGKYQHLEILTNCREIYIDDDCPKQERQTFVDFASDVFQSAQREFLTEQSSWPAQTDSDRLDRVEAALRDHGILLWQASPCCDTCSGAELPDRVQAVDHNFPGFGHRIRGYSFFIDQNLPEMLLESTQISVYLSYGYLHEGWFEGKPYDADPEEYPSQALGIAHEICSCLRDEAFEVDWNGSINNKIGISLNWQRRELLS